MRKVVVSRFVTLDGVMEAPHNWSFPYWSTSVTLKGRPGRGNRPKKKS